MSLNQKNTIKKKKKLFNWIKFFDYWNSFKLTGIIKEFGRRLTCEIFMSVVRMRRRKNIDGHRLRQKVSPGPGGSGTWRINGTDCRPTDSGIFGMDPNDPPFT